MRVFVTGATGYIGSAVAAALTRAGHRVVGLVRSAGAAAHVTRAGATAVRGDLKDPASWRAALSDCEALVHAAFEYGPDGVTTDRRALETLLDAARTGPRVLIYTSGVLVLGNTGDQPAAEDASTTGAVPMVAWRPAHERLVLEAGTGSLATAVVRPGFVYGGAKGLLAGYFQSAVSEGAARYVGNGSNRMALVHQEDVAQLYRLVLETGARGIYHGVDGAAPRIRELARAASAAAGQDREARSVPVERAREMMGPFADALCTDQVVITRRAAEIGWTPSRRPALDAMDTLFDEWRQASETPR